MRVIRWKNSATGVESLNITATGIYFPVGKTDSSFKLKLSMVAGGQTASVDTVRDSSGSRTGYGAMNVSGTTETKLGSVISFATGIIVTAISGTLNAILDDEIPVTNFPEWGLGRFLAKEDADAYVYGATVPQGLPAIISGTQYTYGGAGSGWVPKAPAIAGELIAAYEAEIARSEMQGYRNESRTGLPVEADTPTISASASAPASDADVAAQEIKIFATDSGDPLTPAQCAAGRKWLRGWNPNLRARVAGDASRLSATIGPANQNGNQDQDSLIEPGTSWGITLGVVTSDFWLDSDVLFFRGSYTSMAAFELYVNGNLCTNATVGANITQGADGRSYYAGLSGYTKIKFSTAVRRHITLVWKGNFGPRSYHTRLISSISPVRAQKVWLHSGDSFSQYTISDTNSALNTMTLGLTHWIHSMFGFGYDFINIAIGGTSLSGIGQVLPSTPRPYTAGMQPSNRKTLLTATKGLNASIFTALFGHNDALYSADPAFESEFRAFVADVRSLHPNALIVVFGADASPGLISGGYAVAVENKMSSLCSQLGVIFVPLQTGTPPVLTGSGKQGSTNGTGNSDLYTGPDGTHPTAKGHRDAYGLTMARGLYAVLKSSFGGA